MADTQNALPVSKPTKFTAALARDLLIEEEERNATGDAIADPFEGLQKEKTILGREDDYRRKRLKRMLSPERADPFSLETPAHELRTYGDIMVEQQLDKDRSELTKTVRNQILSEIVHGDTDNKWSATPDNWAGGLADATPSVEDLMIPGEVDRKSGVTKSSRWDLGTAAPGTAQNTNMSMLTPMIGIGGETPLLGSTPVFDDSMTTPLVSTTDTAIKKTSRWDLGSAATPGAFTPSGLATPSAGDTPMMSMGMMDATPGLGVTPLGMTGLLMATPSTPSASALLAPDQLLKMRIQSEIDERNRAISDIELDAMLPQAGYEIIRPPPDYVHQVAALGRSIRAPAAAVAATPTPLSATPLYTIPEVMETSGAFAAALDIPSLVPELADVPLKPEDEQFFSALFASTGGAVPDEELTPETVKERKIATLLLKIKNGAPPLRRSALRQITEKAKEFGPGALFNQILPLMMQSALEDQERHLLVKVIDRILYKLDEQVRPYVHKILVVIEPLLIDEDYYARVEGREVISNLAKAAGLAAMIATMRPDIDHPDEYVRNTTARAFAVVASALGVPSLILFLKAVCQSKKSWQARHTGVKIIQQIAILMGCAVLPYLKQLVEILAPGLQDEQQKVRTITALALAALAEASVPYGIEAFDCVLRPLWKGITEHRGKGLAAFLKAIGLIIPLMDAHHANYYTREVMIILIREFVTPDEEMKKIVMKVVKQCVATKGVEAAYVRQDILPFYFPSLWVGRNALDSRNFRQLVETTVELANKVGGAEVIGHIVEDLKDPSGLFRKMTMETLEQICLNLGIADVDSKLEEMIVDGMIYAFQEMTTDDTSVVLDGFASVINCMGRRCQPYLPQITGVVRWRLGTPSARSRQQAADLVSKIAVVIKLCGEEEMLRHLSVYLYEYLGEEYPEVLGSILGALKAIVNVMGMEKMMPPIKDLLPRLTPILKNRHEKVQENVIDLIGRIADKGGELVSPKEWDRICFDLLELLKAHKKAIRRATVNSFGYIARAIGPHDVIQTLLNNLKVQERQLRVCTTVAIAIVAETCLPYTVLPALMNEYRVPELNIQNGVLKATSFMFEYIGEMSRDYVFAVTPMLQDALMDRDLVHRQTAAWAVKHLALGVQGLGCEDALQDLLNFIWPNIFETSPHLIQAVFDAVDGFRVALGPCIMLSYIWQGLFHPARKVREVYWRLYNNVYIGHQDAVVAFYPELTALQPSYRRNELYFML